MDRPQFVYVTYIARSPERVWNALIDAEMTTKYWHHVNVSDGNPAPSGSTGVLTKKELSNW